MSLALDFLKDWLNKADAPTQGEFANTCGISPASVSDILSGDTPVSNRNLSMLLRGLRNEADQTAFITAYLRDQVPSEFVDEIQIRSKNRSNVAEDSEPAVDTEGDMIRAFSELPSDLFRRRVVTFLLHLRKDPDVRDLFTRTVAFLDKK